MRRHNPAFALALACLLCVSAFVAPVSATGNGMVGVPNGNIHDNVPSYAKDQMPSDERFEGSVMTTTGASTLQVSVTTKAAARGKASKCSDLLTTPDWCKSPDLALQLTDNQNHEGRKVAIPEQVIVETLGYRPEFVNIRHESGETYSVPVVEQGDVLVFNVEKFSTNTVTFGGSVNISAEGATNGTKWNYDVSDLDSVGNYSINVTGDLSTETDTETASSLGNGDTTTVDVAGTESPTSEELTLTGNTFEYSNYTGTSSKHDLVGASGSGYVTTSELQINNSSGFGQITGVYVRIAAENTGDTSSDGKTQFDLYISEEANDDTATDGTHLGNYTIDGTGWKYIKLDTPYEPASSTTKVSFGFDTGDSGDGVQIYYYNDNTGLFSIVGGNDHGTPSMRVNQVSDDVSATVNGTTHHFGAVGTSGSTKTIDLSKGSNTIDISTDHGTVDTSTTYTERTTTIDPTVTVNGNSTGVTGQLDPGVTKSLTTDTSWISSSNTVKVTLGSTSSDAPNPQVDLDYKHDAKSKQEVSYNATTWEETYNVSKTYADATENTELVIPFDSSRVVAIGTVEKRINGGSWQTVSGSNLNLNNTTLTVQTGDVSSGDKVEVRATGRKVKVTNGRITVVDPTTPGDTLDTKFEVEKTSTSNPLTIDVGETQNSTKLHYTYKESWSDPSEDALITASGSNKVRLPNAVQGGSARMTTIPVEVIPKTGEVAVEVKSTGMPIKIDVTSGGTQGHEVKYRYLEAVDGEKYLLYSVTADIVRDSDTANSPVLFVDDDDSELLKIMRDSGSSSDSDSDSDSDGILGGPIRAPTNTDLLNSTPVIIGGAAAILAGLALLQRRVFNGGKTQIAGVTLPLHPVLMVAVGVVAVATLDRIGGGQITAGLGKGLAKISPALGLIFGTLLAYGVYKRFIKGSEQKIVIKGRTK